MEEGRRLTGTLKTIGEKADGVEVLGMHHHQRAGLPRHRHDLEDVAIGKR